METFSASLAHCTGNSPVTGEFPSQRPVARSFDIFFDMHLNKRVSELSKPWWFKTPSSSLWRHYDDAHFESFFLFQGDTGSQVRNCKREAYDDQKWELTLQNLNEHVIHVGWVGKPLQLDCHSLWRLARARHLRGQGLVHSMHERQKFSVRVSCK